MYKLCVCSDTFSEGINVLCNSGWQVHPLVERSLQWICLSLKLDGVVIHVDVSVI